MLTFVVGMGKALVIQNANGIPGRMGYVLCRFHEKIGIQKVTYLGRRVKDE